MVFDLVSYTVLRLKCRFPALRRAAIDFTNNSESQAPPLRPWRPQGQAKPQETANRVNWLTRMPER